MIKLQELLTEGIKNDVEKFVNLLRKKYGENGKTIFTIQYGSKFAKIVTQLNSDFTPGKSVWGFVALKDSTDPKNAYNVGDLLKAATWKAPAKHARGNILDKTAKYGRHGPEYIR